MTRTEKMEWLRNADTATLLNEYESAVRRADKVWEYVKRDSRYTIESIFEDLKLCKAEVIRRITGE